MKHLFGFGAAIFLFIAQCVYSEAAIAETVTTYDKLVATGTLTVGTTNLFSFTAVGISSYTTPGIRLFTVPAGISQIYVKAWGGGGGGGGMNNCNAYHAGDGAGGSFASGVISVTPGEVLTIGVGFGGVSSGPNAGTTGKPGGQGLSSTAGGSGGSGGNAQTGSVGNGGGGAASGVFRVTTSTVGLVIAGGGGAGGGFVPTTGPNGGSASAQGVGGAGNADGTAGASSGVGGGGGGGGATSGGTGGGASLGGTTGNSSGTIIMYGSGMTAGNTSDVDYSSTYPATGQPNGNETVGVGTGGEGGTTSCYGQSGNSGAVILYNVPTASATATILGNLAVGNIAAGNITAANLTSGPATILGGLSVDSATFTGAASFQSAVTFSSSVYGAYFEVASALVSAATSYSFGPSVVTSSAVYRLEFVLVQNTTAGDFRMRVNAISSGYRWVNRQECDSTAASQSVSTSDSAIQMNRDTFEAYPGRGYVGAIDVFQTEYATGRVIVLSRNAIADNVVICENHGTGTLATAPGLNTITVFTNDGTFTGTLKLYRRWDK